MNASVAETDAKWAVILCGGKGSRMGDLSLTTPKPLLPVHGKPILWYTFWTLYNHGFRHFVLPLGYQGDKVDDYIRSISKNTDCQIHSKDTGIDTSIAQRMHAITELIPDKTNFFLLNSDTIFDFDIEAMYQVHLDNRALVTLSSVEVVSTWGLIYLQGEKLVGFDRRRKVRHFISDDLQGIHGIVNSGLAWVNKEAFEHVDLANCQEFESTLYQKIIDIQRAAHFQIKGLWYPIDTPKDLNMINLEVEDRHATGEVVIEVRDRLEANSNS